MGRIASPRSFNFARGLETTSGQRNDDPFVFPIFQNARVQRGNARRRFGMVKVGHFTAVNDLMLFDGINDFVSIPPDVDPTRPDFRALLQFTMETLFHTTNVATDRFIIGPASGGLSAGVNVRHNTTGSVVTTVEDTAGTITTMTHTGVTVLATHTYQLKRDGAALVATIDGVAQVGVMSPTLLIKQLSPFNIGSNAGTLFYLGRIDFFRAFRILKPNQDDGRLRLILPRKPSVIFDYVLDLDVNGWCLDRGPLGLHARSTGSPVVTGIPLAINPAPILGIALNRNEDAVAQAYVRVAGAIVPTRF